ncbi:MAG: chemotaxis protein CheW [Gammaproteobacteria bacterium]|nr:chemotaxis protein CheW [Gammaproteobacteria bacterium]MCP5202266.1 chemotaxis protein CheW [Gammaproteobacteria bacterium]
MSAVFEEQPDELLRWVTFRLADEGYGINVMQVQEVLRITDVAPVPGAPHFVLGIINLRGNVVTVLDMRKLLGLMPGEVTEQSRIMVIESGKVTVGLLVDSVAEVVNINASQIDPAPSVGNDDSSRYIQGVFSREDQILILIDLNKLISEEERDAISMF